MRRLLVVWMCVSALAAAVQPLQADLHYAVHMEARPLGGGPTAAPAAPGVLPQMLLPTGPADTVCWVGDKGVRAELSKRMGAMAAGSVLVRRPDGTGVVMSPADRSYWKTPTDPPKTSAGRSGASVPKFAPTGQVATIAGIPSERVARDPALGLELWIAQRFRQYAISGVQANPLLSILEVGDAVQQGFIMRAVVRGQGFGNSEMEFAVTSIKEEPAPAGIYEVPAGYKEVPAPVPLPANR